MGVMKSGADRARRLAEGFGHLDERVARVVVQHEDRSFVGRQPAEATLQLVTITDSVEAAVAAIAEPARLER